MSAVNSNPFSSLENEAGSHVTYCRGFLMHFGAQIEGNKERIPEHLTFLIKGTPNPQTHCRKQTHRRIHKKNCNKPTTEKVKASPAAKPTANGKEKQAHIKFKATKK